MRVASLLLTAALVAFPATHAISLYKRDVPAVVGIGIERKKFVDPVRRDRLRQKRDSTIGVDLVNNDESLYSINITLGTPPQQLQLALDTGSSDLVVNAPNSTLCAAKSKPCHAWGTFDTNSSSTYKYLNSELNNTYADGTATRGNFGTDVLHIGGTKLKDFEFAIAYESTTSRGILGVGYIGDEGLQDQYSNLPKALAESGAINSIAYSIWMDDRNASTGQILFGGVNTAKYHGKLQTLPILPGESGGKADYFGFYLALTGVALQSHSGSSSYSSSELPIAMVLDTGSSLSYLPKKILSSVYKDLNVTANSEKGVGYIPCSMRDEDYNITFSFSGVSINVAISELVLDPVAYDSDGSELCLFGISQVEPDITILGDTFIRSAYVVYDLSNNEISLAQANFKPGKDNILEIGTGKNAVPGATAVSDPVTSATGVYSIPTAEVYTVIQAQTTIEVFASASGFSQGPAATSFNAAATSGTGSSAATATSSKGLAAIPTSNPAYLIAGLVGGSFLAIL